MKKKIIILGDSISQGIGSQKINYEKNLAKYLEYEYEIINLSYTGTTIKYALSLINKIKEHNADIVLVMYGNVDAQLRPNINGSRYGITRIIPKRYKKNGMLDPRPFNSKKWYRYIPDRVDNILRLFIRKIVVNTQGLVQWVNEDDFINMYQILIDNIKNDNNKILLVSTIMLDERYYPGCIEEYKKFNACIKELSIKNGCEYIDLFNYVKINLNKYNWDDLFYKDHYHPNSKGYELIAKLYSNHIRLVEGINE